MPSWTWAQNLIDEVNNRITVLTNLVGTGKYISDVSPLTNESGDKQTGWRITYSDGNHFDIFNGKDGDSPEISMVQENEEMHLPPSPTRRSPAPCIESKLKELQNTINGLNDLIQNILPVWKLKKTLQALLLPKPSFISMTELMPS